MKRLAMMTYNIRVGRHVDRIIDWVNRLPELDVICFQEFPEDKVGESVRVLGRIPYGYRFAPSFVNHKRVFGELTLYRKDRLRLVSSLIIPLGLHPAEKSYLKSAIPRQALTMKFTMNGKKFLVTNVHLVAIAFNRARYKQIEIVMKRLVATKYPSVILGDYNVSSIIGKRKLIHLLSTYGYATENGKIITARLAGIRHQVDYIFSKQCFITNVATKHVTFSDHYPVFCDFRLPLYRDK